MRTLSGIVGAVLLVVTATSMLRNLVVPRGLTSILVRGLLQGTRRVLLTVARPWRSYLVVDSVLAWLAPTVLIATLVWWLLALFVAYGLLLHAISGLSLVASLREAGSSLFTLGFASTDRARLTAIDFAAAATGPLVIALQIAYLPTLYGAYNRRETEVTLLQSRAGDPAWGPELLARQALVGVPAARLMLRAGFTALRDIAHVTGIRYDPDPMPDGPLTLTYEEFAEGVDRVTRAGFIPERTVEHAWDHFRGWRVNYETIAYELARRVDAVPAWWSGHRDWPYTPMDPIRPVDRRPGA